MGVEQAALAAVRAGGRPWPAWIEVDLDAVARNVRAFREMIGPRRQVAAVVKAQAYGHGAVPVAVAALEAGAAWLAVARVREGAQLRQAGIEAPILVMGPAAAGEVGDAVRYGLCPTLSRPDQANAFSQAAMAAGAVVRVHVKLDTGISRYGIPLDDAGRLCAEIRRLPGLAVEGVYSHFATADETDLGFARQQLTTFSDALAALSRDGHQFSVVHMAASAGALALGDEAQLDMIRIGLSLYGAHPSSHLRERLYLVPVLSMHSTVMRVFDLAPGQSVGYGRTYIADRYRRAALVTVGYADGLPRSHSNRGAVLIAGARAPIIGRVSMDQCVVDVSECGPVAEGDPVAVIGSQGRETIGIDEFAALSGTISYEALTSLGYRVPRVYTRSSGAVAVSYLDEGRTDWL
jgi:alanine racemase